MPSASPQTVAPAQDFARTVKDAADIVKIIGDYVRLSKAGAQNYRGLCPFHKEKSPSFTVHATQRFYHCFGCHESGDVFTFVQKIENVTFAEALRTVAAKAGVPLPKRSYSGPEEAKEARQRGLLLQMHEVAAQFFQQQLQTTEGSRAREYLASRELPAAALEKFSIGYAPDSFTALRDRLQGEYDEPLLRMSGLFGSKSKEEGGSGDLYDRFRKRITFPIRNEQGRVIAFTARALETNEKAGPKYLNSPETPLYSKGAVLFNLDLAKTTMRQYDFALLVEGQMDCIRAYVNGVPNVIATSGTAFTELQVRLLKHSTRRVVVNFDPDTAGANAAEKSIGLLIEEGFEVKVLTLEDGLDPDRFIRERGAKEYVAQLKAAPRYTDFLIERARKLFPPNNETNRTKAVAYIIPHLQRLNDIFLRDDFRGRVEVQLGISDYSLRQALKSAVTSRAHIAVSLKSVDQVTAIERLFLKILLQPEDEALRNIAKNTILQEPDLFRHLALASFLESIASFDTVPALHDLNIDPKDRTGLVYILDAYSERQTEANLLDSIGILRRSALERRQRELRTEITAAERSGDAEAYRALCEEKLELDRSIREL